MPWPSPSTLGFHTPEKIKYATRDHARRACRGLKANGAEDVLVVVGGTIPKEDSDELKERGVAEVFTPGAPTTEIIDFLKGKVPV